MSIYNTYQMNELSFKYVESELLDFGNERSELIQDMEDFDNGVFENLRYSMVFYCRRFRWLDDILDSLTNIYNKVDVVTKRIIIFMYMDNEQFDYISVKTGISVNRLNEIHKLIVGAVGEDLGVFRESDVTPGERGRYVTAEVKQKVLERDKGRCVECGVEKDLHFHHIFHHSLGGGNNSDNLMLLCASCHAEEHKNERPYHLLKAMAEG